MFVYNAVDIKKVIMLAKSLNSTARKNSSPSPAYFCIHTYVTPNEAATLLIPTSFRDAYKKNPVTELLLDGY